MLTAPCCSGEASVAGCYRCDRTTINRIYLTLFCRGSNQLVDPFFFFVMMS